MPFSEHLSSQAVKLKSIFTANKARPVHDDKPTEVRQVLNSIGENPLPGEFELLMKLLKDSKASTAPPPTLQRSKSMGKKQAKQQLAKQSIILVDDFIESWTEATTLARKTATLALDYETFKVCIGNFFFFMYMGKVRSARRKSRVGRRASASGGKPGSSRPSYDDLTSELDKMVANAAALVAGDETPPFPGSSFEGRTSINEDQADPGCAAASKVATSSFDEILKFAVKDLMRMHQDVVADPTTLLAGLNDDDPQTPDEQLHNLQVEWEAMLTNVFRIYTRIWTTSANSVLPKDAFLVYLKDSGLFKKVSQSIISNVIDVEIDTEVEDCIDVENFVEANNLLLKENWVAKMLARGANQEQLIWNNNVALREIKACYERLHLLFDLYEMPSRASNFQRGVLKAKVDETVTADIGSSTSHSINQHHTRQIDFWSGATIKLNSVKGGIADSTAGESSFSSHHKRADVLALIVDRSVVQDVSAERDGQEEKKTTTTEDEEAEGGAKNIDQQVIETEKMSNTGMSILDMAKKMTVTVDETNQPKAKGEDGDKNLAILRPPPVDTARGGKESTSSGGAENNNKLANAGGVKFTPPSQLDNSFTNPQSTMKAPGRSPGRSPGRAHVRTLGKTSPGGMTSPTNLSPKPPGFASFRRSSGSGNKKKHRKVFKKQFGLSRGIQPFQPRLSTSSRERKRTSKKMTEKCDQIMQETKKEVLWR